jgi:hypothetical protein
MTNAEITKLLALDVRRPRFAGGPQKRNAYLFASYVRARVELMQLKSALRRYIEISEKLEEMKWCHATLRELDEIRALAGLPKRVYEKKDSNCGQQRSAG